MSSLMEAARELQGLAEDTAKDLSVAKAAQRKTQIDNTANMALLHATAPEGIVEDYAQYEARDDGIPPAVAQNVAATPIIQGLAVSWDTPPPQDQVKAADIRITPQGGSASVVRAAGKTGHTFLGLEADKAHAMEVRLIDTFGRTSGWSPVVQGIPMFSAAEYIDLQELDLLGRLQGLLPNENLGTIEDATKLGKGIVTAEAMAVQNAVTFSLWATEAMIGGAYIKDVRVDTLTGGELNTTAINIASLLELAPGGSVKAGEGTTMDDGGVTLAVGPNYNTPTLNRDQQISAEGDWASLAFFDDTSPNLRGAVIRSDGNNTVKRGMVALHATEDGALNEDTSARIEVIASAGGLGRVFVYEDLIVNNNATADDFLLTGGGSLSGTRTTATQADNKADAANTKATEAKQDAAAADNKANNALDRANTARDEAAAADRNANTRIKNSRGAVSNENLAIRYVRFSEVRQDKDGYMIWAG